RIDSKSAPALAGAGEAAFEAGDYTSAQRYLGAVESPSARVSEFRSVTEMLLASDRLRPGLSLRQRQDRVMAGFRRGLEALDECVAKKPAAHNAFESLRAEAGALAPELTPERLRRT